MNFVPSAVIHPQNGNVNKQPFRALGFPAPYKPQNLKPLSPVPRTDPPALETARVCRQAAPLLRPRTPPHAGRAARNECKWENTNLAPDGDAGCIRLPYK